MPQIHISSISFLYITEQGSILLCSDAIAIGVTGSRKKSPQQQSLSKLEPTHHGAYHVPKRLSVILFLHKLCLHGSSLRSKLKMAIQLLP